MLNEMPRAKLRTGQAEEGVQTARGIGNSLHEFRLIQLETIHSVIGAQPRVSELVQRRVEARSFLLDICLKLFGLCIECLQVSILLRVEFLLLILPRTNLTELLLRVLLVFLQTKMCG